MQAIKIKEDVYWVGVQDPHLEVFDIVMKTEYGTSYNAYLIRGNDKTALVETVKDKFFDEYIEDLQKIVKLADIDYLIMNHTEPDHSGSVEKLLQMIPGLVVMGSATALTFLKEISNSRFSSKELEDGEEIDLGGKTLQFISAPFLHWPDTIYTYLKEDKILFSCDSFGSHYSDNKLFNDLIEFDFTDAYKYYFDMIMGPFKPYVLDALEKIKELEIEIICPGHGPVLRQNLDYYTGLYKEWATPDEVDEDAFPKIVMAYVTAYGFTETIAGSIEEGLAMIGEFNFKKYNLSDVDTQTVLQEIEKADGLLIGSPTINGDTLPPIWDLLTRLSPIEHGDMVAAAFGAYGWSGEAVPNIENRLNMLRMKVLPGLRINFKPSERNLEDAFKLGMDFARAVLEKRQDVSQTQWRCLICGHIHEGEAPPDICPACGVGKENFVKESIEDEFINDTDETFVLVGGGIASLSAVQAIRQRNRTARIVMLTEENEKPYYRPVLSDYLSEDIPDERFYIKQSSWYEEERIEIRINCRVSAIDTKNRELSLKNGEKLVYDKLILATGARSNVPPFKGVDKQGVYTLRNFADANLLKKAISQARKAVVIGGGVLGLEAVWEMLSSGLEVSVVEFADRIMPRQLDESSSRRYQKLMENQGVKLYLGLGTEEILGEDKATAVRLSDGQILEADLVLLSTGVRPNIELAAESGIEVDKGIVVDKGMRTVVSGIYAAGDAAQIEDKLIGIWPVAVEMGKVAGANAAGDWLEYKQPVLSTSLIAFDRELFSVGDVNLPVEETRITEVYDPLKDFYKKSFMKDGVLVGEIIIAPKISSGASLASLGRDAAGKKKANRWKCRVCGYIHEGPEPPETCPVCGAPKEMFDPIYE